MPTHVTHTDGASYWYYSRTTEGLDYPSTYRVPATSRDAIPDVTTAPEGEQLVMDAQALSEGHDFFSMGLAQVSPDGHRLAYSIDVAGDERYDVWFTDLDTGQVIDGPIQGVGGGGAWAGRDWFFYTRVDAAWRPHEVWRHRLGSQEPDALVASEPDERFWIGVDDSRDHDWIIIDSSSKLTTEVALLPASDPTAAPRVVAPRRQGVDYSVEVAPDGLWILHNDGAPQFALSRAPLDATSPEQWEPVLAEDPRRRLTGVSVYERAAVVEHRTDGLSGILLLPRDADGGLGEPVELTFDEALYDVGAEEAPDFDTDRFRFGYESLVSPPSVWEYRLDTGERRLLKETPVLDHPTRGAYDRSVYVGERLWATAEDGTRVPVSLVRHRDTPVDGTAPGPAVRLRLLRGSHDALLRDEPAQPARAGCGLRHRARARRRRAGASLVRGRQGAHQEEHVRGLRRGRAAAGRRGPRGADRLLAEGGSAGGLLIGAAINLAPALPCGARGRPVRRSAHHDPEPRAAAHGHGVGGVGATRSRTRPSTPP